MLSLFAVPKPFVGPTGVIQRNALESWRRLDPAVEIILIGDEEGTRETAGRMGLRHVPVLETHAGGAPLLSSIFAQGEKAASHGVLGYINADIILLPCMAEAISTLLRSRLSRFLMVGPRWDIDLAEPIDFETDWVASVRTRVREQGRLYVGFDYFVYRKGTLGVVPPFLLGRGFWDRWLLYHAYRCGIPLVDASADVTPVHQNHANPHHPEGKKGKFVGKEPDFNRRLAGAGAGFDERAASRRLEGSRLRRNTFRESVRRLAFITGATHPGTRPLIAHARSWLVRAHVLPAPQVAK